MEVECEYDGDTCCVESDFIPSNKDLKFDHDREYKIYCDDITKIVFSMCDMSKIPLGLTKAFKNLVEMEISSTTLKNLTKNDLIEYKDLEEFHLKDNKIEFLPGDLFEGFKSLTKISIVESNLKFVEPCILDGLPSLSYVDFGKLSISNKRRQTNPKVVKQLLNDKFETISIEKWMKQPLSPKMLTILYEQSNNQNKANEMRLELLQKTLNDQENECQDLKVLVENLSLENKNMKIESEKQSSLTADLKAFIQDESTKDFQIQIDNHEFQVHKFLLAARSPTLAEILKNNPEVENLNLVDISVEIFEIILKFLYTDELPGDDGTNFLQLFAAAGKLKIEKMMNFASKKLIDTLSVENALEIFKIGSKYEHKELKQRAFEETKRNYPKSKINDEWIEDAEKVEKLIRFLKKMEDAEKEIEDLM